MRGHARPRPALAAERVHRFTATAHVKTTASAGGQTIRTEAGASVQGNAGAQPQTVT